jgi:alanine dehydrogenase
MIVGCVKEIKKQEFRVGLTPANVQDYVSHGHKVIIECGAGEGSGFEDAQYGKSGAILLHKAEEVWSQADMIVKVKEPLMSEWPLIRQDQILYTYLHLAADRQLTDALLLSGCKAVAYETVTDATGGLPLLRPMSEVAGRLCVQKGAHFLEKTNGGAGVLLGGVPGVTRAKVVVLGAGIVGTQACKVALGMGADVTVLDKSLTRLAQLDVMFDSKVKTIFSCEQTILEEIANADLVIGAVLIPGASTPKLIRREHLSKMKAGSVIVDVAVDQGGCVETSHVTYHEDPVYTVDGVLHYGVANIPGAVPRTSTVALTNATIAYGLKIADLGLEKAAESDMGIQNGINVYRGRCTCQSVANSFSIEYTPYLVCLLREDVSRDS